MTNTTLNFQTARPSSAAAAGKRFYDRWQAATEQLFQWADFQPGETVLEFSFGISASLAKNAGVRVVGVERNPDSVARARANIQAAGLVGQVEVLQGIFSTWRRFRADYVLAEAILTMQSPPGKTKILRSIHDRLQARGQISLPELPARKHEQQIHGIWQRQSESMPHHYQK